MNGNTIDHSDPALLEQSRRLQELMVEMAHCCQERMQSQARRFNLRDAEFRCLLLLGQERYATVKGIAAKLGVAKSRATIILDGLLRKGILNRTADPNDARVRLFGLTPAGKETLAGLHRHLLETHLALLAAIHQEQRPELLASLEALRASMRLTKHKCAPDDEGNPAGNSRP